MRYGNGDITGHPAKSMDQMRQMALAHAYVSTAKEQTNGRTPHIALSHDGQEQSIMVMVLLSKVMQIAGAVVHDILGGPEDYLTFAVGDLFMDGGIFVTSRTGGDDITLAFKTADAEPLDVAALVALIKRSSTEAPNKVSTGKEVVTNKQRNYVEFMARATLGYGTWPPMPDHKLSVVVDLSGSEAGKVVHQTITAMTEFVTVLPFYSAHHVKDTRDVTARVYQVALEVVGKGADMGLSWDADGLRLTVLDSRGDVVHPFHVSALLGACADARWPDAGLVSDQRAGLAMLNSAALGSVNMTPALPGQINGRMREVGASFGAGAEGQYYFREVWWNQSGVLAALVLCNMAYLSQGTVTNILDHIKLAFPCCGPVCIPVKDAAHVIETMDNAIKRYGNKKDAGPLTYKTERTVDGALILRSLTPDQDWRSVVTPTTAGVQVHTEGALTPTDHYVRQLTTTLADALKDIAEGENA